MQNNYTSVFATIEDTSFALDNSWRMHLRKKMVKHLLSTYIRAEPESQECIMHSGVCSYSDVVLQLSPMLKISRVEIKDRLKYYKVSVNYFKFNLPAGVPMIQPFET